MKKFIQLAGAGALGLALAACGGTDDASTEAEPDTVEMPADEALEPVTEEPVEDPEMLAPADPADTAPDLQTTEEAADAAADVAAEAAAAAAAAEAAADIPPEE
ncbi:hypothetical protein CD351_03105 [Erythrobacter sp. KY5]|uniref:hypothetical protein n=1 Tax=Erythrobacter sp. KY5 TaxID=2011159 RepID=UPI000DBF1858|nr:hypothetical protein [Erythrobacter sp. KY5]AWW73413.1 hypothetical protein CD351_03105 [Erythrobacter sp. KY5]